MKTDKKKKTGKTKKTKKTRRVTKKKHSPGKLFFLSALAVIAAGYIATATYLYINQRKFLYYPQPGVLPTSEQAVEIQSGTFTLRGWVLNENSEDAIIYFAGNAERPENSLEDFKYLFNNQTVYMINYRGYGESDGEPSEKSIYIDAMAIYDYAASSHSNISVIGRSLGTGVAVFLATERDVHRLILVEPYSSLQEIAQDIYPIFPMSLLMKDKYNSAQKAPQVTARTLIITAENDEVIPFSSTQELIDAFNPDILETASVPGASHNNIADYTQYYMLMRDFVNN